MRLINQITQEIEDKIAKKQLIYFKLFYLKYRKHFW